MKKISTLILFFFWTVTVLLGADPTATLYNSIQCEGSLTPYPSEIPLASYPDSLAPVYISHVGRHGSRYPASSAHCTKLLDALKRASTAGTITTAGTDLLHLTERIIAASTNRWGALDSLGMAEQRAIASRMVRAYGDIFVDGSTVNAVCSYSPRCMMSMFSFVHQLDRMNNKPLYNTSAGRRYSYLMRPFDTSTDYLEFSREAPWKPVYDEYFSHTCPTSAILRVLGQDFPFRDNAEKLDLAITEYYVLAGLRAMEMPSVMKIYFTTDEMNALWSCFNLRQYLQRTSTTVSTVPADISADLVLEIVTGIDAAVEGNNPTVADLRFGHAETLMPLLSLIRLRGCYYLTNYFDTVALHWKDFDVVPMAANLQIILFRNTSNKKFYVKVELNEHPVSLIPGDSRIYLPWGEARRYLMNCVPLYAQ